MTNPSRALAERLRAIVESPTYRLAYEDTELLGQDDLRPLRLQLELLKPERILRQQGVYSTVVVFGSARVTDPVAAGARLAALEHGGVAAPANPVLQLELALSRRRVEQARRFAQLTSSRFQQQKRRDFVVVTGGGPGIMEAPNRGTFEAGARSIGLNITRPHKQVPNPYLSPELAFHFQYFALRKMHFLLRARALVAFPGEYGTRHCPRGLGNGGNNCTAGCRPPLAATGRENPPSCTSIGAGSYARGRASGDFRICETAKQLPRMS